MIEKNEKFLSKFQELLCKSYLNLSINISSKIPLSNLILRTGKIVKNGVWHGKDVLDLSSMPNNNIFINDFSNGDNFKTNIKSINNYDLVYGSIRPYFKKSGIAIDVNYIAGTVFSFRPKNELDYIWLLALICSNDFHLFTTRNSQGTKMPMVNWDIFGTYNVPYDREKIIILNKDVGFLLELAINKAKSIRKLKKIKNVLLKKYF